MHKYSIDKKTLKNDVVLVTFIDNNSETIKINISLDDYYEYCYKENVSLSLKEINLLKEKEPLLMAKRSALIRLATKDYSIKKMKDYLKLKFDLSNNDLNNLLNELINNNYLNDDKYTKSKVIYLDNEGYSKKTIINKLKNEGISESIINKYIDSTLNDELSKAKLKALKYNRSIKNKSVNAKKQAILNKLCNEGFSLEVAKKSIVDLDFNEDIKKENDVLNTEFTKLYKKYCNKYDGYDLKKRLYANLISKGFDYESVNKVLNRLEKYI